MSPAEVGVYQKGKPWPGYFLVRTTGEVVPLIAADELPHSIEVVGVPRSLDLEETIGMLNLGLQRSSGCCYQIIQKMESKTRGSETVGKANVTSDITSAPSFPPSSPQGSVSASTSTRTSAPKGPTNCSISRSTVSLTVSPAATQLCHHWCTHGICKWGQRCRYLHTMPMTLHRLQEVGLSDWPVWFRKENPGYFASESRGRGVPGRIGRGSRVVGNVIVSAGAYCSPKTVSSVGVGGEVLRGNGRVAVRDRASGSVSRSDEPDEQIIARLKGMSKKDVSEKVLSSGCEGNVMTERMTVGDIKNWEDEIEEDLEDDETYDDGEKKAVAHGKLINV